MNVYYFKYFFFFFFRKKKCICFVKIFICIINIDNCLVPIYEFFIFVLVYINNIFIAFYCSGFFIIFYPIPETLNTFLYNKEFLIIYKFTIVKQVKSDKNRT